MKYLSGEIIKVGDLVWYMNKTTTCTISEIIDSEIKLATWGLDKYGVFLCCDPLGGKLTNDIFVAKDNFVYDDITPVNFFNINKNND